MTEPADSRGAVSRAFHFTVLFAGAAVALIPLVVDPGPGAGTLPVGPELVSQQLPTVALEAEPEPVDPQLVDDAVAAGLTLVGTARQQATDYSRLDRGPRTLEQAASELPRRPREARRLAQRILEMPQSDALSNRAWWIIGEAEQRLGDFEAALAAWNRVGETVVDDHLQTRRIAALLELDRATDALLIAETLVDSLEGTNAHTLHAARELRMNALYAAGHWEEFGEVADDFLDTYPEYPRADRLAYWRGTAALNQGNLDEAVGHFDDAHWVFPYRPSGELARVELEALAEQGAELPTRSLNERFERIRGLRVNKHWALVDQLLEELVADVEARGGRDSFANEIRLEWVRNSYGQGDFGAALTHLEEIVEHDSAGIRHYTLYTWFSDTYARLGRHDDGVEALRRRDEGRSRVHRHQELAEYYFENGFYTESLEHELEVRTERRQHGWDFSLLLFLAGEYEWAERELSVLAEETSGRNERKYRYWHARTLQQMGDLAGARSGFERVREEWPRTYYGQQANNRLWELDQFGPLLAASSTADDVATAPPATADGPAPSIDQGLQQLADSLIHDLDGSLTDIVRQQLPDLPEWEVDTDELALPARLHWDGPSGVSDASIAFTASRHEVDGAYVSTPDRLALVSLAETHGDLFPTLPRAEMLHAVGLPYDAWWEGREAVLEFRALDGRFDRRRPTESRPHELNHRRYAFYIDNRSDDNGFWGHALDRARWPLPESGSARRDAVARQLEIHDRRNTLDEAFSEGLMVLGDYHIVRRFVRERGGWGRTNPDGERNEDWSQAYPRAYPELVTRFSEDWGLNPYVIWALMTVESSYNPDSVSRANARGLLQVIPKTGELISERLDHWDFGPSNLMNPELSVEFGCYYFSELMAKFHGQELLAFSAYNAGPHQMARWLEGRGDLPLDAFIETIPFEQAREYTKKVYRFLALFRLIYLDEDSLYVGQSIDPTYENNIHF